MNLSGLKRVEEFFIEEGNLLDKRSFHATPDTASDSPIKTSSVWGELKLARQRG
jgi:hypothetical protein